MKCPKCGGEKVCKRPDVIGVAAYFCENPRCGITWTEWQQSRIAKLEQCLREVGGLGGKKMFLGGSYALIPREEYKAFIARLHDALKPESESE